MGKKQFCLFVVLLMVSGFLGGMLSSWFFQSQAKAEAFDSILSSVNINSVERFVSEDGSLLASIELALIDGNNINRASMSFSATEPRFTISDSTGSPQALLAADQLAFFEGATGVVMLNQDGLAVQDSGGNSLFLLATLETGERLLQFFDSTGRVRFQGGIGSDGEPVLKLFDTSGNTIFDATTTKGPVVPAMVPISWLILAMILSVLTSTLINKKREPIAT